MVELVTQVVVVTEELPPLVTTSHLVVDRVLTDVSSMKVLLVETQTKVLLESMVVLVKDTETHQG